MFEGDLCRDDLRALLDVVMHEGMHASDGIVRRILGGWAQPEMTSNHQSIYDRVRWEMGEVVLTPVFPEGTDIEDHIGVLDSETISYESPPLWGIEDTIIQVGSDRNSTLMTRLLPELYDSLYLEGEPCGCD
jgi:hypothetical protein